MPKEPRVARDRVLDGDHEGRVSMCPGQNFVNIRLGGNGKNGAAGD